MKGKRYSFRTMRLRESCGRLYATRTKSSSKEAMQVENKFDLQKTCDTFRLGIERRKMGTLEKSRFQKTTKVPTQKERNRAMKLLINTEWFAAMQDLPRKKQIEILEAILDYPNRESKTNLWQRVIKPQLETGSIQYYNKLKNLKQNQSANPQKSATKNSGSDTESDTESGIREDINNIYNNSRIDIDNIYTTRTRTRAKDLIEQTATGMSLRKRSNDYVQVTPNFVFPPDQFFDAYRRQLPDATARAEQWIRKSNLVGKLITAKKMGEIIQKFSKNQKNT